MTFPIHNQPKTSSIPNHDNKQKPVSTRPTTLEFTLKGDSLPDGKLNALEQFTKQRSSDLNQIEDMLSKTYVQNNERRYEFYSSAYDFMQNNSSATFADARRYYSMSKRS